LTWLKYRRLPALTPPPAKAFESVRGGALAVDAARSYLPQESVMPASEDTSLSVTSSDNHADDPAAAPRAVETDQPALTQAGLAPSAASWNLALAIGAFVLALVGQFFLAHIRRTGRMRRCFLSGPSGCC
jgi:hypothetical protein